MEVNKFRGEVFTRFKSKSDFAKACGWKNRQKAQAIIEGVREPSLKDVQDMAKALMMDADTVASFFLES